MRRLGIAFACCLLAAAAVAETAQPDRAAPIPSAAAILFEAPQLASVQPEAVLSYRYHRESGIAGSPFGPAVDDHIRLTIAPGDTAQSRTVRVNMLSGERHRAAGPFEDVTSNPVLILFLEHHLGDLSRILGGNPRYLKNAIRAAMRDRAAISQVTIQQDGRRVPAWRIEVRPFAGDPNAARMRGFETLDYVFVASDAVPGMIVSISASADSPDGKLLQETLTYEQGTN